MHWFRTFCALLLLCFPAQGAITFVSLGKGVGATGSTTLTPLYPSSPASGNIILACVENKYPPNGPAIPSPFGDIVQVQGGAGASGADSGQVFATVGRTIATGSESGTVSIPITSGNSAAGLTIQYNRSGGSGWTVQTATGTDNTSNNGAGAWSIDFGNLVTLQTGDVCVVFVAVNGQTAGEDMTNQALTGTGLTFSALAERDDVYTNLGDDSGYSVCEFTVTAGSLTSGNLVFTADHNVGVNRAGCGVLVILRETSSGIAAGVFSGSKIFGGIVR